MKQTTFDSSSLSRPSLASVHVEGEDEEVEDDVMVVDDDITFQFGAKTSEEEEGTYLLVHSFQGIRKYKRKIPSFAQTWSSCCHKNIFCNKVSFTLPVHLVDFQSIIR